MRFFVLIPLFALIGCDSAGPGFRKVPKVERSVEGSDFTLRFAGGMVEAIRTSPEWLPRFDEVARKASFAAEAERPGCTTEWVEGDAAMMLLGMACNGQPAPPKPARSMVFHCDLYDLYERSGTYDGAMECSFL